MYGGPKRNSDAIKAVSLFCGCGGSDLGLVGGFQYLDKKYSRNNINVVHASDIDEKAINSYNLNFYHQAVAKDIKCLKFKRRAADLVIGGFPCQSFSTVNPTKNPGRKETQLFWEMARVIDMIQPKAFIAENVKGFYRLAGGKYFRLAKDEFHRIGYSVFDQIINASDYGVPQKRERLFMVGIKKTLKKVFLFPQATHFEDGFNGNRKIVLGEIVKNLVPSDEKYYFSKRAVEGVKRAKPNMKRALAQNLNQQCLTITSHLAKVSLNSRDPVLLVNRKKELYRRFTPKEAASIQSFPGEFKFSGSEGDAYRQIGNAIPPVVMWRITRSLIKQVFS